MATGSVSPFSPLTGGTVSIAVTTTSAEVTIPPCDAVLITNSGTVTAFVRLGPADLSGQVTLTASATADTPVLSGTQMLLGTGGLGGGTFGGITHVPAIAAVTATGTATLYITPGHGTQR